MSCAVLLRVSKFRIFLQELLDENIAAFRVQYYDTRKIPSDLVRLDAEKQIFYLVHLHSVCNASRQISRLYFVSLAAKSTCEI